MPRKFKVAFEVLDIDSEETAVPKQQIVVEIAEDDLKSAAVVRDQMQAALILAMKFVQQRLGIEPESIAWLRGQERQNEQPQA